MSEKLLIIIVVELASQVSSDRLHPWRRPRCLRLGPGSPSQRGGAPAVSEGSYMVDGQGWGLETPAQPSGVHSEAGHSSSPSSPDSFASCSLRTRLVPAICWGQQKRDVFSFTEFKSFNVFV